MLIFKDEIWGLNSMSLLSIMKEAQVSQSLSVLRFIIDIYKLSAIEICWPSSKVEEIFGIVETGVKIEELVDVDRVKALSNQDHTCSSEIAHTEGHLNNLSSKASKLKVKGGRVLLNREQVEILSRFEEKGSGTGLGEGEEPSQEFDGLCTLLQ
ncbi:hypothetical protein Cgig2_028775 [Carnegiea gigantea]|uniref:Uncharacterized protein n=1 Tax=Carnegiea gigantea TaxID=171969 RepID=A0A9Q1Q6F0_9CARY|nr:hypothetical protein Cgig2_028775 [Carnegiea gigantea]